MSPAPVHFHTMIALAIALFPPLAAAADWPQWGGSASRNNVADVRNLPADFAPGEFDRDTNRWKPEKARNIKWVAQLGSQSFGTPVIADGRIFVGTNNGAAWLKRYPNEVDLGCLLCFRERDGQFLWQFSAEKLPTGRVHDWPLQGIVSSPLVEKDRAWFVSNRGEVVCLDTEGFYDDEDDGPVVAEEIKVLDFEPPKDQSEAIVEPLTARLDKGELTADLRSRFAVAGEELPANVELRVEAPGARWSLAAKAAESLRQFQLRLENKRLRAFRKLTPADKHEADVVWRFDMMDRLGSRQHNLATCCITSWKDTIFVCTGNGVGDDHRTIPAPQAPSFVAMDKRTGEVLWTSNLPGANIHHGQWSAPAVGVLGGVPQVVFCGGDGWVYSFHAEQWERGSPRLLWKFDTNAKDARLELGGRGTRNEPIAPPVLYDDKVFVTTGQDPEHGEGPGCIWCIDATRKLDGSDVSPHKVVNAQGKVVPPRRVIHRPAWKETQLWGGALASDLDRGVAGENFRNNFWNNPLPKEVKVKALTRGVEWELTVGSGESPETMYVWKRSKVNDAGEWQVEYVLVRRTDERIVDNPDSAVVWKYDKHDGDGNGKIDFQEEMHRSISSVVIHDDLLFCPDFSGLLHCLDVKTGKPHWTCDLLAACWATPLVADGRLFVADEDGDVSMFRLSADPAKAGTVPQEDSQGGVVTKWLGPAAEINMDTSIYCNPIAANGVLYVTARDHLFAIEASDKKP